MYCTARAHPEPKRQEVEQHQREAVDVIGGDRPVEVRLPGRGRCEPAQRRRGEQQRRVAQRRARTAAGGVHEHHHDHEQLDQRSHDHVHARHVRVQGEHLPEPRVALGVVPHQVTDQLGRARAGARVVGADVPAVAGDRLEVRHQDQEHEHRERHREQRLQSALARRLRLARGRRGGVRCCRWTVLHGERRDARPALAVLQSQPARAASES